MTGAVLAWADCPEAAATVAGTPELLADLFELIMLEIASEVEGKCYYIVFY